MLAEVGYAREFANELIIGLTHLENDFDCRLPFQVLYLKQRDLAF